MRPLSERLEEIATHYDGDCCDSCDAKIISAIREGAQLAKRYEEAPVHEVSALPGSNGGFGGVFTGGEFVGQSVRLVREPARRDSE